MCNLPFVAITLALIILFFAGSYFLIRKQFNKWISEQIVVKTFCQKQDKEIDDYFFFSEEEKESDQ